VDTVDKMCVGYIVARNTHRWHVVVFCSMLNIAAVNALVIHRNQNCIGSRKQFLRTLAQQLVQEQFEQCPGSQIPQDIGQKVRSGRKQSRSLLKTLEKRCQLCTEDRKFSIFARTACNHFILFFLRDEASK
jgi:hypothetical protein